MMGEAENYADLLVSDAATAVFSEEDAQDAKVQANNMREALSLAKQCQTEIFKRVSQLKKRKFQGSQIAFPQLGDQF